jgi:hypothetical protein
MERKLALWFGLPFLALAWMFMAILAVAPELIHGALFFVLILGLATMGIILAAARALVQLRSGEPPLVALSSIAVIIIATGVSFHKEIFVIALGLLK